MNRVTGGKFLDGEGELKAQRARDANSQRSFRGARGGAGQVNACCKKNCVEAVEKKKRQGEEENGVASAGRVCACCALRCDSQVFRCVPRFRPIFISSKKGSLIARRP